MPSQLYRVKNHPKFSSKPVRGKCVRTERPTAPKTLMRQRSTFISYSIERMKDPGFREQYPIFRDSARALVEGWILLSEEEKKYFAVKANNYNRLQLEQYTDSLDEYLLTMSNQRLEYSKCLELGSVSNAESSAPEGQEVVGDVSPLYSHLSTPDLQWMIQEELRKKQEDNMKWVEGEREKIEIQSRLIDGGSKRKISKKRKRSKKEREVKRKRSKKRQRSKKKR